MDNEIVGTVVENSFAGGNIVRGLVVVGSIAVIGTVGKACIGAFKRYRMWKSEREVIVIA